MSNENEILWTPSSSFSNNSNLNQYISWLKESQGLEFPDYNSLHDWSISEIAEFWKSCIEYFEVKFDGNYNSVFTNEQMPHVKWFDGIKLNYSEHIFRNSTRDNPALIFKNESNDLTEWSWEKLTSETSRIAAYLKSKGIKEGDAVVGYLPTIPEASVAFLAANSIGAVWSSTSPDFGEKSVIDRFKQIQPRVLFCTEGYGYGGKTFDKIGTVENILSELPSVEEVIVIPYTSANIPAKFTNWNHIPDHKTILEFNRVDFSHPIWILYSSGTTGLPKALTHSHGGILLEHLKYLAFHNNIKKGDKCFWYTTTGWMMWNYIQSSWLLGGVLVLYDGSPAFPDMNVLWELAQNAHIQHFGTSAGFVSANMKSSTQPGKNYDLSKLISIGSTGSPLPPEGFSWLYKEIKADLWLASISGGSDVCSAFVGGNPIIPVRRGEIQSRALGCALDSFDENGRSIRSEVGEMVITRPMPSMPIYLWNDPDFIRYSESYFEMFPGIWRHGDWIEITPNGGVIIFGRSDSTLNRGGIRIGTSEIYRAVDTIEEVSDSLIICVEYEDGEFYMPLFVKLKSGAILNGDLVKRINTSIRSSYSPRHVPDEILEVNDIPYTISGKKVETPVKKIFSGKDLSSSLNRDALRNPKSLDIYVKLAKQIQDER